MRSERFVALPACGFGDNPVKAFLYGTCPRNTWWVLLSPLECVERMFKKQALKSAKLVIYTFKISGVS